MYNRKQLTKSAKEIILEDALKNVHGKYAIEFYIGQSCEQEKELTLIKDLFGSISFVDDVTWCNYKSSTVVIFNTIKASKRSWLRVCKSIVNCFKDLGEDGFVRIRVYKDVHFYENNYIDRMCIFDNFISFGNSLPINLFANLFIK